MVTKIKLHARGQSLVFYVIISFALLAFMAIIVDGGMLLSMRRLAQNAADAGALAGARELCVTGSPSSAIIVARNYAVTNNEVRLGNLISQEATATAGSGIVSVTANVVYGSFFARILGMDEMTVNAFAQAGCFPPGGVEGEAVVPIAWRCPNPFQVDPDTGIKYCPMEDYPDGTDCTPGQDYMYVFFDLDYNNDGTIKDNGNQELYWCSQWGSVPAYLSDNGLYPDIINCDANSDGQVDIEPISPLVNGHKWYWINTNGNACGASEENNIIQDGLASPMYSHWWYPACSGDKASVYNNIKNYRMGDTVVIPVFDQECQTTVPGVATCGAKYHTNDNYVSPPGGTSNWFHLTTFASFKVHCATGGSEKCDFKTVGGVKQYYARGYLDKLNPGAISNSKKSIEGCFIRDFIPGLIPGDPSDGVFSGSYTLVLIK